MSSPQSDRFPRNNSTTGEELLNGDSSKDDATSGQTGFGIFSWRPRCLQIFAKPFCFMIVLNIYCLVEGTIVSGMSYTVVRGGPTRINTIKS